MILPVPSLLEVLLQLSRAVVEEAVQGLGGLIADRSKRVPVSPKSTSSLFDFDIRYYAS